MEVLINQITQTKTGFLHEQWKRLILECQTSGLAVHKWCELNGVKKSYYYYVNQIRKKALTSLPVPFKIEEPVTFKKLAIQSSSRLPNKSTAAVIHLPTGSYRTKLSP